MKARLKNHRIAPRKMRLAADAIRGKRVAQARLILKGSPKQAASSLLKLLDSAVANASANDGANAENLYIKELRVDEGVVLRRFMPRAFARATPIHKRTSHVSLVLAEQEQGKTQTPNTTSQTMTNSQ